MTPQLSACTSQTIAGRRRKAFRFAQAFDAVHALADDANDIIDVCVTLAVHAGIAASDVICCSTLGHHSQSRDHHDAIGLLRKCDGRLATDLQVLLDMKSIAAYSPTALGPNDLKRAERAMTRLVAAMHK